MISSEQKLTSEEIAHLNSLIGTRWHDISGPQVVEDFLAWANVRIETNSLAIQLSLDLAPLNIAGDSDDYPFLHVVRCGSKSKEAIKKGRVYFHGQGEVVHEIWFLRETFHKFENGELYFENVADISIAIKLDTFWISFSRAAHFSDSFNIQRTTAIEEIAIPDILEEWEESLMDQYTVNHEWIQVG